MHRWIHMLQKMKASTCLDTWVYAINVFTFKVCVNKQQAAQTSRGAAVVEAQLKRTAAGNSLTYEKSVFRTQGRLQLYEGGSGRDLRIGGENHRTLKRTQPHYEADLFRYRNLESINYLMLRQASFVAFASPALHCATVP